MKQVLPHAGSSASKTEQVSQMFDDISPKYDLLNRVLSMRIDVLWRKRVLNIVKKEKPQSILDIATGTGDLAIAMKDTGAKEVIGVDISEGMMAVGREKVKKAGLEKLIHMEYGDAQNLKYADGTFDVITVGFGVRNFENLEKGLAELYRVLKPGGILVVLEFSQPEKFPIKQLYKFYSLYVLPVIGRMVSKNVRAYTYLPESINVFPYGKRFAEILRGIGFKTATWKALTFGIASVYTARK